MNSLSVIIPTYNTEELVKIVIKSFEAFKPKDLTIKYFVVENSEQANYKDAIKNLCDTINYIDNFPSVSFTKAPQGGSYANADAIEVAKKFIEDEYTFICHSDICVTSKSFFTVLEDKIKEGNRLVGMSKDNIRINAAHISGVLVTSEILKKISVMPDFPRMDVGDSLTQYCVNTNTPYTVIQNTFNDRSLVEKLPEPYKSWGSDCGVDRSYYKEYDEVIYMHLGRGTEKSFGSYNKQNKMTHKDWLSVCETILNTNES